MQNSFARTDLACEEVGRHGKLPKNVTTDNDKLHGLDITSVIIGNETAAKAIGKPRGKYLTIEMSDFIERRGAPFADCAMALSELLRSFGSVKTAKSALIACLGNRAVTPNALGPYTAEKIIVTRHLKATVPELEQFASVSVLRTGVLGTTGIESAATVRSACGIVHPDCVIAVDALASGDLKRLCRNIQLCDSGISPGSGVGNDRQEISADILGVPVIAVGVPTVTDADEGMFVTPRNIDELVRTLAKVIAYGINLALQPRLSVADIDELT